MTVQVCLPASHAVLNSFGVSGNSVSRNLQISRDSFTLLLPQSRVGTCKPTFLLEDVSALKLVVRPSAN